MSNFRVRLRAATETLAIGKCEVKNRLELAVTNQLLLANFPDDPNIPQYFRVKLRVIIEELSSRSWPRDLEGDHVRATIHAMRLKTAASFARRVWNLYNDFEEYLHSGFIPPDG